ncbi:MAG TPA: sodium:proton antiporter [Candidatus Eisenbacteria bacterium]|nr:sodium:proton antiporter [Candidatus Eisenbacteria bacterium]
MGLSVERAALLMLIAAVVGIVSRRLRLPYSVGLVIAGLVLALLPISPQVTLTKSLLFSILLPPLIFEAALRLDLDQLRKDFVLVFVLATAGVVLSAAFTTMGMRVFLGWPWITALLFGSLISATDPVSVIAIFKGANLHGRLLTLVESESLLNDGTAAVLFSISLSLAQGHSPTVLGITTKLLITIAGSIACGFVAALGVSALAGRTNDHLIELTFTTVAAYGSFILAENLNLSGVLATLVAGLIVGNKRAGGRFTDRGREAVEAFWEYAAFVANSLVFLLIGIRVGHEHFLGKWSAVAAAIVVVLVSRAFAVYPCCALFLRSRIRVSARQQHVLFWGGLRGALALALALALPPELPDRSSVVSLSFAIVVFSIFVQGLTIKPLLRHFGEIAATRQASGAPSP